MGVPEGSGRVQWCCKLPRHPTEPGVEKDPAQNTKSLWMAAVKHGTVCTQVRISTFCTSSPCAFLKQGPEPASVVHVHTYRGDLEYAIGCESSFITKGSPRWPPWLSQTPNMIPCQCVYSARRKISFWGSCWHPLNQQDLALVGLRVGPQIVTGHCGHIYSSSPIFDNMLAP